MALAYIGNPVTQCQIVQNWSGLPCCFVPLSQCVFAAPSTQFIVDTLGFEGLPAATLPRALSFDEIRAEIDNGSPIIVGYTNSFNGHVVLLYGYDDQGPNGPSVAIHDPFNGSFFVRYADSFAYQGAGSWSETILTSPNTDLVPESRLIDPAEYQTVFAEEVYLFESRETLEIRALEDDVAERADAMRPDSESDLGVPQCSDGR